MALHYSTRAKSRAHDFMLDELDRHGIAPERVLTLPSVDGHCALALRRHFGETITEGRTQEWTSPSPCVTEPRITIIGIERQGMIVLRSTLVERGVLQEYWATTLSELVESRGQIEVGEGNPARRRLSIRRIDPQSIARFDLLNLDLTCAYGPNLVAMIDRAVTRLLSPSGLVAITTLRRNDARYGSGEHNHHHYRNANSALTLTCWRPE